MTKRENAKLNEAYPVFQNSNNGLWGFEKCYGCANLKAATYNSKLAATRARNISSEAMTVLYGC